MLKALKRMLVFVLILSIVLAMAAGCKSDKKDKSDKSDKKTQTSDKDTQIPDDDDDNDDNQTTVCNHIYGGWVQGNTPACFVSYQTRFCSICQHQEQQLIEPKAHSLIEGKLESMDENNITARFRCEYCNMLVIENVAATGDYDNDSLTNLVEVQLGTNLFNTDTDGDGINDNIEVSQTNTNPLKADSDDDGLDDKAEVFVYLTNPLLMDTDRDGVMDGKEVLLGFDPKYPTDYFSVSYTPEFEQGEDITVVPSLNSSTLSPEQINTLEIVRDTSISKSSVGYMGDAFTFSVDEDTITEDTDISVEIGFQFDMNALNYTNPTIYELETNEHGIAQMKPVDTTISGNTASALVDKFTTYVLMDRAAIENTLTWIDVYNIDRNYDYLEIVFVMDDSGSMGGNDPYNERLAVAIDLIDKLPANARVAVVKFADYYDYEVLSGSLIDNKEVAKLYLTTDKFTSDGNSTYMYDAIERSFDIFESTDSDTMRMLVVLTDGEAHDTEKHDSVIAAANMNGINIYTIGLSYGYNSSSYFGSYLVPLASETDGEFYYASDASNLADAFNAIGEKISLITDTDGDGLSDYYENNTNIFSGITYNLDMNDPDTDDDGLLDGEEIVTTIVYSIDGTQMSITGVVLSNPSLKDSDGDGILDRFDPEPMIPAA